MLIHNGEIMDSTTKRNHPELISCQFFITIGISMNISFRNTNDPVGYRHGFAFQVFINIIGNEKLWRSFFCRLIKIIIIAPGILDVEDERDIKLPLPTGTECHDMKG